MITAKKLPSKNKNSVSSNNTVSKKRIVKSGKKSTIDNEDDLCKNKFIDVTPIH